MACREAGELHPRRGEVPALHLRSLQEFGDGRLDRHPFALASGNAGPARIASPRAKAAALGPDPDRWRGNVEVVTAREIGRETVRCVANIVKQYFAYEALVQRSLEMGPARPRAGA